MTLDRPDSTSATNPPLSERVHAPVALPALPTVAGGMALHWRPATTADVPLLHALGRASGRIDHPRDLVAEDQIALGLTGERFTLETDTVVALDPDGTAIAYGEAKQAETAATEVEVSLEGVVHPDHRGLGIGRALLAWQEARGRQLLAASDSTLPAMLALGCREDAASHRALYAAAGFAPVRWWMELRRPLSAPIPDREPPAGVSIVPFSDRLSEATRAAVNDAFRDHWGSQPITRQEWEDEGELDAFAPHLSRLAVVGAGTRTDPHRVVGFALSELTPEEWDLNGGSFGYLSSIGVIREWRGRGLSSVVITAALRAYHDEGLQNAILDVDAENPSGALAMYERLGFVLDDRSVTYAKRF